jgi:YidC/Oxa1 family membrane protein insertase
MDRKGVIGVVACIVLYFVLQIAFSRMFPPVQHPPAAPGTSAALTHSPGMAAATPGSTPTLSADTSPAAPAASGSETTLAPRISSLPEQINVLENEDSKITFTSRGAAIKTIDLKKHREGDRDVILNDQSRSNVMAVTGWPGTDSMPFAVQSSPTTLTYTGTLPGGVTWTRTYTLGTGYILTAQDTLANPGANAATLPAYSVSVGRAKPLLVHGHYQPISNQYTGAGWLTVDKFHLTPVSSFNPQGWFFNPGPPRDMFTSTTVDPKQVRWLASENQFFAVLLTPDAHYPMSQATFQCFNARDEKGYVVSTDQPDIESSADFPALTLPAAHATTITYSLYMGPKEYGPLNALGDNQGELMNYDGWLPFSLLIRPMLGTIHFFNDFFHSYGVAIILLTLIIKVITWPLQSFANRSGKRMQALAPKVKELQAKYKDQPEKISSETMTLYRDFGVNPFGGCLPALVQMPVFFSLYYMLQNAVELRGQHFLWVKDLTQPDTVFAAALPFTIFGIGHLVINPLPIMVTALMAVMMRMTPQMGDPQQQKIAQFMPLFFLFLFYNFAAALSLYYVINNGVSIFQIYRNLRKPLPELKRKPPPAKS